MLNQPAFPHREILKWENAQNRLVALQTWLGQEFSYLTKGEGDFNYPLGVVGPLPIKVSGKSIEWAFAPIATTEGALVASYQRGCKVLIECPAEISVYEIGDKINVFAEVVISDGICKRILMTQAEAIYQYWEACTVGVQITGTKGANGHFANGITGFCLATGLDLRNALSASLGSTICNLNEDGGLEVKIEFNLLKTQITDPVNLFQKEARMLIEGPNKNNFELTFPAVLGALTLSGELSIMAAMASGQFARAHERLGRR